MKLKIYKAYIKNILFPERTERSKTILEYYMLILLVFYPLLLFEAKILDLFDGKTLVYFLLTLFSAVVFFYFYKKGPERRIVRLCILDIFFVFTGLILMIRAIMRISQNDMGYEKDAFLWCLIGCYFLLYTVSGKYKHYLTLLLLPAVFLFTALLAYYLKGEELIIGIEALVQKTEGTASWLILTASVSSLLYCLENGRYRQVFYLLMSGTGFLLLFLNHDTTAICITGIILLIIPLAFIPTAALVKKNLLLCFLFLVIAGNYPLLLYTKESGANGQYNLRYGIYIDLLLSIIGVFICKYWDRVPKNRDPESIIMKKMQRWYGQAAAAVGIMLTAVVIMGSRTADLPDKFGIPVLKSFSSSFLKSMHENMSFFQFLLEEYGFIGCMIWICLIILIIRQLLKQWKNAESILKVLIILSFLFIAQTFLYNLQTISTPIYVIILTFALRAGKNYEVDPVCEAGIAKE